MNSKPQAPYRIAVKMYGPACYMYGSFDTIREAEKKAVWHRDNVGRAISVIVDANDTPIRIHDSNRIKKIDADTRHIPAERMVQEANLHG